LLNTYIKSKNELLSQKASVILTCVKDKILSELFECENDFDNLENFFKNRNNGFERSELAEILSSISNIGNNNKNSNNLLKFKRIRNSRDLLENYPIKSLKENSELDSNKLNSSNHLNDSLSNLNVSEISNNENSNQMLSINNKEKSNNMKIPNFEELLDEGPKLDIAPTTKLNNFNVVEHNFIPNKKKTKTKHAKLIEKHVENNNKVDKYFSDLLSPSYEFLQINKIEKFLFRLFSIFTKLKMLANSSINELLTKLFPEENESFRTFSNLKNGTLFERFLSNEYSKINKVPYIKHYLRKWLCIRYKKLFVKLVF